MLLTIVTLLVYWFAWHYQINDEARRYLRDDKIKPWLGVLASFPGVLILDPFFVSVYHTAQRIERIEEEAASPKRVRPGCGPVFAFLTMITFFLAASSTTRTTSTRRGRQPATEIPARTSVS